VGSECGHHRPSHQGQAKEDLELAILGFSLVFLGIAFNACLIYMFWKRINSRRTPAPRSTAMVTELTDQGVNQANNDYLNPIAVGKIEDGDEPDKNNPDAVARSYP
jgi:hypothetical protein